jgi:hypothetical protein
METIVSKKHGRDGRESIVLRMRVPDGWSQPLATRQQDKFHYGRHYEYIDSLVNDIHGNTNRGVVFLTVFGANFRAHFKYEKDLSLTVTVDPKDNPNPLIPRLYPFHVEEMGRNLARHLLLPEPSFTFDSF